MMRVSYSKGESMKREKTNAQQKNWARIHPEHCDSVIENIREKGAQESPGAFLTAFQFSVRFLV